MAHGPVRRQSVYVITDRNTGKLYVGSASSDNEGLCEYLTRWGPGLLRLGAIMSFGGYCVSRPGLLRLGAVVG